jgi:curved DNA-binding protein
MPDGDAQMTLPPGSGSGRKLRLKGKGLPGAQPGDLYAVLSIAMPAADTAAAIAAYRTMASAFSDFNPRANTES